MCETLQSVNYNFDYTLVNPPKNKNAFPAEGVEARQTVLPKPETVAQSSQAVESPPSALVHIFIATFAIRNPNTGNIKTEVVEVPHTQKPRADQEAAWKIIRERYPKAGKNDIRRSAGRIVSRTGGVDPVITFQDGATIRQLFPDRSEFEAGRTVGTVIYDGALCDITLRHIRAKSVFSVSLKQPGGTTAMFSEQITTTRLLEDLPRILVDILGPASETIKLYLRKAK